MTDRELLQQALWALKDLIAVYPETSCIETRISASKIITALEAALAQPEQLFKYSDIVSDGGLDPRNKFDAQPEQEFYPDWDMIQPYHDRIAELEAQLAQPEQAEWRKGFNEGYETAIEQAEFKTLKKAEEQEPDAWRNAAIRLGEDLYSVGPNGYYNMTAKQWFDWALSVVNTASPKRKWVGLTSEDWENTPDTGKQGCERDAELFDWIEQTLKDKNT